jgi:hypothetical protein
MRIRVVAAAVAICTYFSLNAQQPPVYTAPTPAPAIANPGPTPAVSSARQPSASPAASPAPPPAGAAKLSAADLEKLVQPIALHPDPLIAVILPASVYPLEIVQAARFVKDTNNIPKVDEQPWDDNVKELAKFPEMIAKMDADLNWTMKLGEAFLDQPKELMDIIQSLRTKAHKAGTLQTTPQQVVTVTNVVVVQTNMTQVVTVTNQIVEVAPANPQVVYVPSYPPTVYYPPPAYVYNPYAPLITFGVGMAWGAILANNCNWGHGHVDVDVDRNVNRNVNRNTNRGDRTPGQAANRASTTGAKAWQPDQNRMRTSGAGASASTREARGWGSSTPKPSTGAIGTRPSTGAVGARPSGGTAAPRPSTGAAASRPSTGSVGARPSTGKAPASRPAASPSVNRASSGGSAFSGGSSGANARSYSNRGASSAGSSGFSGSRGGGGRGGGRGGGGRR